MGETTIDSLIQKNILDKEFLNGTLNKIDEYGEKISLKTIKKLRYTTRISETLGLDTITTNAIMVGYDMAKAYHRDYEYIETTIKNRLKGANESELKQLLISIKNSIQGEHKTPEELIVKIINYGFEYADSLEDKNSMSIFMGNYEAKILEEVQKSGKLSEIVIPKNNLKHRAKINS